MAPNFWWIAAVTTLVLATTDAVDTRAEESSRWKIVGEWDVRVDASMNYGCFMIKAFSSGTVLRMGFDKRNDVAYIILGNDVWKSLEQGKEYQMAFYFESGEPYEGTAVAWPIGDTTGLFMSVTDANFFIDFMKKQRITLIYQKRTVDTLRLNGTFSAGLELLSCQDTIDQYSQSVYENDVRDPFSNNGSRSEDPFAR